MSGNKFILAFQLAKLLTLDLGNLSSSHTLFWKQFVKNKFALASQGQI
jgi:hypothetical protein